MRNYFALFISLSFLVACGGGGGSGGGGTTGSTGTTIPVGSVSGTSFDGLILGGTVSVYDFSTGAKGALLGQTTSDSKGLYSLTLQVESRPVLMEVTGGYYVEEAGVGGTRTQVLLGKNHLLTAVANYTTGASLKVAVTTYTHLAAGLAAYQISQGTAVSTAINDANTRASSLVGVNILTTTPKEITDIGNASATLTPELRYGFLAGAISMWTYNHAPKGIAEHSAPYSSIDFAQLLYQDISADGLLDGFGFDSAGVLAPLSFGTTLLGPDVYRLGLGVGLMQMAGHANNKTGLDGAKILSFAQAYIANSDTMFSGIAPTSFAAPIIEITSPATNAWARKSINVTSNVFSPFGLKTVELLVDSIPVAVAANLSAPTFSFDTTAYLDGTHAVSVRATDLGGFITTASIQTKIDNTPPTTTGSMTFYYYYWSYTYATSETLTGTATDNLSGAVSVAETFSGQTGVVGTAGAWSFVAPLNLTNLYTPQPIRIMDAAGNCSDYTYSIGNIQVNPNYNQQTVTRALTLSALGSC